MGKIAAGKKVVNKNDTSSKKRAAKSKKLEPKKLTKGIFNGIEYDSLDELGMIQWLFELKGQGYIKNIKRADSYLLSDTVHNSYVQQIRSVSSRIVEQNLLHGHSYTPEFEVVWDFPKSKGKFVWDMSSSSKFEMPLLIGKFDDSNTIFTTVIEVKPSYDQNNMERLFKLNQKWMWDKYKIFVNLVKINDLFPATFTPKTYLTTPSGRVRVLKYTPRKLFEYVNDK